MLSGSRHDWQTDWQSRCFSPSQRGGATDGTEGKGRGRRLPAWRWALGSSTQIGRGEAEVGLRPDPPGGAGQAPRGALEPEKRVASQFAKIDTRRLSGGLAGGGQRARPGQHLRELRPQRPTRQRRAGRGAAAELEPGFDPGQLPAPAPARPEVSPGRPRGRESRPGSGRQRAAWRARSRRGSG